VRLAQFPFHTVYFDEAFKYATTSATEYSQSVQIKKVGVVREMTSANAANSKS